jgi:hypothetical protein
MNGWPILSACKVCHFYQEQKCILGANRPSRFISGVLCRFRVPSVRGMTECKDYVHLAALRNANRLTWTITVLSLVVAILTLLVRYEELKLRKDQPQQSTAPYSNPASRAPQR